jgi:hypothetical protein
MIRQTLLATACLMALAPAALAHSFNVVVALPAGLSGDTRSDISTALLVASEERDGHAEEESDGHLGGLDVYLTLAAADDPAGIAAARPDIVVWTTDGVATVGDAVALIPLPASDPKAAAYLARAASPGLSPFAARFSARTGKAPDAQATTAYLAARQIDVAVRALGGVDDRAGLADRLAAN